MESLKVYILIANRVYNDGIRSGLGLAVENHYAFPVIMNGEFPRMSTYMAENIAWISDMGGPHRPAGRHRDRQHQPGRTGRADARGGFHHSLRASQTIPRAAGCVQRIGG